MRIEFLLNRSTIKAFQYIRMALHMYAVVLIHVYIGSVCDAMVSWNRQHMLDIVYLREYL